MPPKTRTNPEAEESGSRLLEWAAEKRKFIVGAGAVVILLVLGLVLYAIFKRQAEEKRWANLLEATLFSPLGSTPTFEDILENGGPEIRAHALYCLAINQVREKDYDGALENLDHLEKSHADSYLNAFPSPDLRFSLVGRIRSWIEAEQAWDKEHAYEAPEVDKTSVALIETDMGAFWLGFYPALAPQHVADFIARAKSGEFNGTSVTKVTEGMVHFGGEASKDDDPENDNPESEEDLLPPESARYKVKPDRGAVASLALEGGESPTRFVIVVGSYGFDIDKKATVFARVLDDRAPARTAVDELKNLETYGNSNDPAVKETEFATKLFDHPVKTVRIQRVSIWEGDEIAEGHEWDVTAVKKPAAEPEAGTEAAPEAGTSTPEEGGTDGE